MSGTNSDTGVKSAFINAIPVNVTSASYSVSGISRERLVNLNGIGGDKIQAVPGMISIDLRQDSSVLLGTYQGASGMSVLLNLYNGIRVVGANMSVQGTPELDAAEGTVKLELKGPVTIEM